MKRLIPFLIIPLTALILYYPVIFTYFSQDDFFHFKISQTDGSIAQFINLFNFHPFTERGIAFYRPIFRESLFNIFYSVFGLNPYPFRILQFLLLFLNAFLAYKLIFRIFKDRGLSFFVTFFYAISSVQVSPLYYLTGGIQVLGVTTFILLTLIFTLKYSAFSVITFTTFLLAIASHELASITPFLIGLLFFIRHPINKAFKKLWQILPYFFILFIYLYLEITKIGFSAGEKQYQLAFSIKTTLNSYMWYIGWAFGLPEMLIDFVFPGFKLNPSLMRYWGNYYLIIFLTFFVSISCLATSITYLLIRKRKTFLTRKLFFFIFWFLISLTPVILLPFHKSTQYLETGLIAFWTIVGIIIFSVYKSTKSKFTKITMSILILDLLLLSATSTILQRTTYWAATRGRYAKQLIEQVTNLYPTLPKGSIIYFKNDPNYPYVAKEWGSSSKQAAFILNNEDALQLTYKDPLIKVYYEDSAKPPSDIPEDQIINIISKIY